MLNLKDLAKQTDWVAEIDSDFQLDLTGRTLWAVFSAESPEGIPADALDCVDLLDTEDLLPCWIMWHDATDEQIERARVFRYIVLSN